MGEATMAISMITNLGCDLYRGDSQLDFCGTKLGQRHINPFKDRGLTLVTGHHNVKIKMMKILEVYQNPSTLVLIVKLLRQAFEWYIVPLVF
jgi:hypothetical protein